MSIKFKAGDTVYIKDLKKEKDERGNFFCWSFYHDLIGWPTKISEIRGDYYIKHPSMGMVPFKPECIDFDILENVELSDDFISKMIDLKNMKIKSIPKEFVGKMFGKKKLNENNLNLTEKILDSVKKYGIYNTSQFVGGYDKLKSFLGSFLEKKDKINEIEDFIDEYGSIYTRDLNDGEDIMFYQAEDETHWIYMLNKKYFMVERNYEGEMSDFYALKYSSLSDDIIDMLMELIIDYRNKN